jgi:pimeloyl-ACP methyl ester carboxylesterase
MHLRFVFALCLSSALLASNASVPPLAALQAAGQATFAGKGLPAAPDRTFTSGEVTLRYREVGEGPPVVLVHGYSGSLASWFGFAGVLAQTHRVIAVDVRGFGQSSKFSDPQRFGEPMADDIVRLLQHLQVDRAHFVGHSMGALITANIAARYSDRVSSAALVAGPFYPDRATFVRESAPWLADLEGGQGLTKFFAWLFPVMDSQAAAAASALALKGNDLPSLIAVMRSLPDLVVPRAKALAVPTIVAVGTGDPLLPLSVALAAGSNAKLVEVKGADHLTILRSPELQSALRELLQTPR